MAGEETEKGLCGYIREPIDFCIKATSFQIL